MKRIACDLFGEGQHLFFNTARLLQLENATGKEILTLCGRVFSMNEIVTAYMIGLAHENKNKQTQWYANKIDALFEAGVSFEELFEPVMKAIVATGVLGREALLQSFPEMISPQERKEIEFEAEKNEMGA